MTFLLEIETQPNHNAFFLFQNAVLEQKESGS